VSVPERMAALFGGVGAVLVTLIMGVRVEKPPLAVDGDRPLVGRAESDVAAGPLAAFRHIQRTTNAAREAARRAASFERFDAALVGDPWPSGFRRIVIHPFLGALPDMSVEEGPPWHIVIERDGAVSPTPRLLKGAAGAPPGLPVRAARRAIHVAVPFAAEVPRPRRRVLMDLFEWLRRRLGERTPVVLAPDAPGATGTLPQGVERTDLLPER